MGQENMALAVKKSEAIIPLPSVREEVDVGSMVLLGMGETLGKIRILTGLDKSVVELGEGVSITIDEQDSLQPWKERLLVLLKVSSQVAETNQSLDQDVIARKVLEADGWSWTKAVFRTPLWMEDYDEVLLPVIFQEFEGLKWIERSLLEIK